MPLQSDLQLDVAKFLAPESEKTAKFNQRVIEIQTKGPRWHEVGAPKYRQMRWNGETPFAKPVVIESGKNFTIPSRDAGREIPCRMFEPPAGTAKGILMHIHGGGWVLQSEAYQDTLLKFWADNCHLIVISVGYRLAPEDPFPAGPNDCYDAAEYLVDRGKEKYGVDLAFVGGESAGGHLSSLLCLHLLKSRPSFVLKGVVLNFGAYDLSSSFPFPQHFDRPLILDKSIIQNFIEAFLPNTTKEQRRDPSISPFWADLRGLKLPPAIFTCGTEDPLLDDTMFMCTKWLMAGGEAVLKIYTGAPHGFILFPREMLESSDESYEDTKAFMLEKLG